MPPSLLLAAAAIAGVARPEGAHAVDGTTPASTDSITVSGNGSVTAVPTTAILLVRSRRPGRDGEGGARRERARDAAGDRRRQGGRRPAGRHAVRLALAGVRPERRANGFAASNVVSATVDVDRAGALIDAAVEAGANQVNGPRCPSPTRAQLYRQALKAAVADARLSAETLAAAAGRSLGKVTTVVESGGSAPVPMFEKAAASDAGTPIEAGTQETTASVTVTFALG